MGLAFLPVILEPMGMISDLAFNVIMTPVVYYILIFGLSILIYKHNMKYAILATLTTPISVMGYLYIIWMNS